MVSKADGFTMAWFIDGRGPKIPDTQAIVGGGKGMGAEKDTRSNNYLGLSPERSGNNR